MIAWIRLVQPTAIGKMRGRIFYNKDMAPHPGAPSAPMEETEIGVKVAVEMGGAEAVVIPWARIDILGVASDVTETAEPPEGAGRAARRAQKKGQPKKDDRRSP